MHLRKINCTLQNALVAKAAWWAAGCYAGLVAKARSTHSNSAPPSAAPQNQANCNAQKFARWGTCNILFRSTIRSTPPTPQPQLRKINCTLQNALVEKAAWCVAMC